MLGARDMTRSIDIALVSSLCLLGLAKVLSVPPELGVPAAIAAALANALHPG
jgi:hypothetical protein